MTSPRVRHALLAASITLLTACGAAETADETPPNVVVVLADTLRADHLGSYGYERETDPGVAALAADAILFEDVRAQAPCTYPSANSILTGRDGSRFWVQPGRRIGIPEEVPSLAEMLKERGYTTVAVSASPIVRKTETRFNPHGGFDSGFDVFDERCYQKDGACLTRVAREYLSILREPYFVYLHYMDPHDPYQPPEKRWSKDGYEKHPGWKEYVARGNPNPIAERLFAEDGPSVEVDETDLDHLRALYDDEISFFDRQLAEVTAALPGDRTLFALVADHGEGFLDHDAIKHCHTLYDHEIRTPLVLRLPDGVAEEARGTRIAGLAQNLDLVPTILDYLGFQPAEGEADPPDRSGPRLDGASLRPLIEEGEPVHDQVTAAWGSLRAVRGERFKLLMDLATGEVELFDLEADPGETRNVAAEHPREVRRLQSALSKWIREVEEMASTDEALGKAREAHERLRSLGYIE